MISGKVTANHEAIVSVPLGTAGGSVQCVDTVVDTGFTEFLALPGGRIAALGLRPAGLQRIFLADGSETVLIAYEATVHWHGQALVVKTGGRGHGPHRHVTSRGQRPHGPGRQGWLRPDRAHDPKMMRRMARGPYSAETMSSIVGPEGGRLLVERTVESLKGMWK